MVVVVIHVVVVVVVMVLSSSSRSKVLMKSEEVRNKDIQGFQCTDIICRIRRGGGGFLVFH